MVRRAAAVSRMFPRVSPVAGIGTYVPGATLVHRAPAGLKLALLIIVVTGVVASQQLWAALTAVLVAGALYLVAGVGPRHIAPVLVPLTPFLVLIGIFHTLSADVHSAVRVCAQLTAMVLLGGLVTCTTRVSAMLALFEWLLGPLRHLGLRPERVALVLALTVRSIPLAATVWRTSREAYLARGLRGRPHRMVVPVLVRLIRSAESTGEALAARGLD
ncbi:energy-coupling factor transporter transmembrane protein EcfT [Lipingzhangella sp. LS1_29]|uniref:Energy-coupling factor transporter transmembrane protein EcfT n=1 Tax=Lipingzhangella rawalii TaxID=2055835 RepID=A0ABU2H9P2_9ACTN|nr:energy-coupling factor transporter transmembrane protein EcfT [Lipingzhangella rawalii]MDS1271983.1 energy-coupling factor transporter transmembrane protein EcfT [Lipingzhangella rawalii]